MITIISFVFIFVVLLLTWLPVFITLRPTYKYYKVTYDLIKSKKYVLKSNDESFISFRDDLETLNYDDNEILYFKGSEGIKLISGYIHKNHMLCMDPYSNYWYKKIKNEIMINSSIEKMRDYKLKQLKIK